MIVEIATHGSSLKRDHDCFVIHNNQEKTEIPAEKVDSIMISANIMLTTQVINLCLEKNVQLVLTDRSGKPTARLWSSTQGRATEIRRSQYINMDTHIGLNFT